MASDKAEPSAEGELSKQHAGEQQVLRAFAEAGRHPLDRSNRSDARNAVGHGFGDSRLVQENAEGEHANGGGRGGQGANQQAVDDRRRVASGVLQSRSFLRADVPLSLEQPV